jgi:hypothetical protein
VLKRFSHPARCIHQPNFEYFQLDGIEDSFTAVDLGTLKVGADNTVIVGPPTEFDANNIDQYNF